LIFSLGEATPSSVGTKSVLTGRAIIVTIIVGFSAALLFVRPSAQTITVRHIKSIQAGNSIWSSFEISNHTGAFCIALPDCVEVRQGTAWAKCFSFGHTGPTAQTLGPYSGILSTFELTNVPTTVPLRLKMVGDKELGGPLGFFEWLKSRYVKHANLASPYPIQIVSDEFVAAETK
jgi:hypothetical protein